MKREKTAVVLKLVARCLRERRVLFLYNRKILDFLAREKKKKTPLWAIRAQGSEVSEGLHHTWDQAFEYHISYTKLPA